jgi:excisionase family DNA binding protein
MKHNLLSVRDAAKYLGVSPRTIYRLIHEGRLPEITIRTKRMVPWHRLLGFKATPCYHMEKHVSKLDLDKLVFDLPKRKACGMKHMNGRFAPKRDWPAVAKEMARKKNLSPIEKLDEPLDFSKFDLSPL